MKLKNEPNWKEKGLSNIEATTKSINAKQREMSFQTTVSSHGHIRECQQRNIPVTTDYKLIVYGIKS